MREKKGDLYFTHCYSCGARIILRLPKNDDSITRRLNIFSCNDCVPEDSPARDGIDESYFTDISKELFGEDKAEEMEEEDI